jgi:hypothetical protein
MFFLLKHFMKRLPREGFKSLSVPLLAFVLVVLINLLGAVKASLEAEYEDLLDNYPIVAELSDLSGEITDGLHIDARTIELFTEPDHALSLRGYIRDVTLRRTLEVDGGTVLTGVTILEGFDDSVFSSYEHVCVVSEDMMPEDGVLRVTINTKLPDEDVWGLKEGYFEEMTLTNFMWDIKYFYMEYDFEADPPTSEKVYVEANEAFEHTVIEGEYVSAERELAVVGTVPGVETVYVPFMTVSELAAELDGSPYYSELLRATVRNRSLAMFKNRASLSFPRVRPIYDSRPHAMTIFDSVFYETLEPLRQNIILVDVATPFIYAIAICVGFLTSVLLSRRRKPEFAVMRSAGVHRRHIFTGALVEQAVLSVTGAALGFALVAAVWGYMDYERPAVFLGCYVLGTVFSAVKAAGTDVLKILREKE